MIPIAPGIWRWTARHPEWHPRTRFGHEVGSYAVRVAGGTVLIDPIAPDADHDRLIQQLAPIVTGRVWIAITIPYHVRDAEPLWEHYCRSGAAAIHGHPAVAKRLRDAGGFVPLIAGEAFADGVLPIAIGNPRRYEMPLWIPGHRALVTGDAIVESGGALRVWIQRPVTLERREWYERRLRPSLESLLEHAAVRVLVTHGCPVLKGGRAALADALEAGPWYHPPH